MRPLFILFFTLVFSLDSMGQGPVPIFSNKADSVSFDVLMHRVDSVVAIALKTQNAKKIDSMYKVRSKFLETHEVLAYRTTFRNDRSYTRYQDLPKIQNKDSITKISITGKWRRTLPDSLFLYKNLAALELIDFKLRRFPKKLLKSTALSNVTMYNNLPNRRLKFPKNKSLVSISIRGDERGMLPASFRSNKSLEVLSLQRNNLKQMPSTAGLKKLRVLLLSGNDITLGTKSPGLAPNLKSIDLSWNRLTAIPSWIAGPKTLRALNFNNNKITSIDPAIASLKQLEELSLYKNSLPAIPDHLYTISSLRMIDLYYNQIKVVSPAISNWKNLEILYLANNEIYTLPEELGELTKLNELYVHHNKLSNLPKSISNLKGLSVLRFNHNMMIEWPAGVMALSNLTNIDLSANQFHTLPLAELDFRRLKMLSLVGNPWDADAKKNILAWIESLREAEVVVHFESYTD